MLPVHSQYNSAETIVFPDAITLKILLSGNHTDGSLAIFEDIVETWCRAKAGTSIITRMKPSFFWRESSLQKWMGKCMRSNRDIAFIPRGTVHAFKNAGDKPGKLRYIFSPAKTIEEMFRDFFHAMKAGELTMEKMAEISIKHGQEFVGPPL